MEVDLKAFISYRRHDSFMQSPADVTKPDFGFLDKLTAALSDAGFANVFVDRSAVKPGNNYESRIYQAIADCDLFVAVIGNDWLRILRERLGSKEHDILVREIRAALKLEKEIVPLLIDGAAMPSPNELPEQIRPFHYQNGIALQSSDSTAAIAATLKESSREAAYTIKLESRWTRLYRIFAVIAWFICAIQPHLIGWWEFRSSWGGLAKAWSGFYIWPICFLPFTLLALYRPITILIERAANASRKDRLTYLTPLALGALVALLAIVLDVVGVNEVPWSVHPTLPGCAHASAAPSPDFMTLSSYDKAPPGGEGPLQQSYGNEFWLKDRCWPNAFYYLTVPVYQGATNPAYLSERPRVRRAFMSVLNDNSDVPYSRSFVPYVLSFAILMWLGCTGIILSMFYVTVEIKRPDDDAVMRIPGEDAQLCLTYAFVTLMAWIPFRINTLYFKKLYLCDTLGPCAVGAKFYLNDAVFGVMLLIGFVFISAGLLVKYKRLALGLLSLLSMAIIGMGAFAVFRFSDDIAPLTDSWQFYVAVSIPSIVIMLGLWYQFDPSVVRFKDFKREIA